MLTSCRPHLKFHCFINLSAFLIRLSCPDFQVGFGYFNILSNFQINCDSKLMKVQNPNANYMYLFLQQSIPRTCTSFVLKCEVDITITEIWGFNDQSPYFTLLLKSHETLSNVLHFGLQNATKMEMYTILCVRTYICKLLGCLSMLERQAIHLDTYVFDKELKSPTVELQKKAKRQ